MNARLALKLSVALGGGFIFWALFGMVFVVYGFFTPGTKDTNQYIFLVAYPILYFVTFNFFMRKIFSDTGWKPVFINSLIMIIMGGIALALVIGMFEFIGLLFGL